MEMGGEPGEGACGPLDIALECLLQLLADPGNRAIQFLQPLSLPGQQFGEFVDGKALRLEAFGEGTRPWGEY
ncbi:hypothetical protein GCM10022226_39240 [Sphaerisporangium flaviroseum]|uniref:Uncharacterized protein n=1 Tax=Sphaerisporangium flaviroseum TaxID=509199 RepID=A0ABP7IBX6_9ACTN